MREDCRESPRLPVVRHRAAYHLRGRPSAAPSAAPSATVNAIRKASTMHAWLCENPIGVEALQWKELPTPEPQAGQVRVAISAASLNFPDLLIAFVRWWQAERFAIEAVGAFGVLHSKGDDFHAQKAKRRRLHL